MTSRSTSTGIAAWPHKRRPISGVFWLRSKTTPEDCATGRASWGILESQRLAVSAASWPEAAAKARYVLNLYAAELAPADTQHRDLVEAVLSDFARLANEN